MMRELCFVPSLLVARKANNLLFWVFARVKIAIKKWTFETHRSNVLVLKVLPPQLKGSLLDVGELLECQLIVNSRLSVLNLLQFLGARSKLTLPVVEDLRSEKCHLKYTRNRSMAYSFPLFDALLWAERVVEQFCELPPILIVLCLACESKKSRSCKEEEKATTKITISYSCGRKVGVFHQINEVNLLLGGGYTLLAHIHDVHLFT